MKNPYVVFDLDGTLADDRHRRPNDWDMSEEEWQTYFSRCDGDTPINPIVLVAQSMAIRSTIFVEIWTGRSEVVRDKTMAWLRDHNVQYSRLLMRSQNDRRPAGVMKQEWLTQKGYNPLFAVEDRTKYVEWWSERGVPVIAVPPSLSAFGGWPATSVPTNPSINCPTCLVGAGCE